MPSGDGKRFSQAILEEAKHEAEDILNLARREAERILEGARNELQQVYAAEAPHKATQLAQTRYKQLVATADLEARKQKLLLEERLLVEVQERVKERLLAARNAEGYSELLTSLIVEAAQTLDGETFEIIVAPEDRELLTDQVVQDLSQQTAKTLVLSDVSEPGITGAIVQRIDKRVLCDNSLQGLLKRKQNGLRVQIAQKLFKGLNL